MKRIIVRNLSKTFSQSKRDGLLGMILHKKEPKKKVFKNISFEVIAGEIVGLTGPNGVGKSTLLRLIMGVYKKDSGTIITKGKIIPLLHLKMVLQWRLSLEENIFYIGTLFELDKKYIRTHIKEIVSFAGLIGYESTPIYQLSEGMKQRMIFSIAIHANADILLLDEVFEIGDTEFRKKSSNAIKEFSKKGGSSFTGGLIGENNVANLNVSQIFISGSVNGANPGITGIIIGGPQGTFYARNIHSSASTNGTYLFFEDNDVFDDIIGENILYTGTSNSSGISYLHDSYYDQNRAENFGESRYCADSGFCYNNPGDCGNEYAVQDCNKTTEQLYQKETYRKSGPDVLFWDDSIWYWPGDDYPRLKGLNYD